MGKFVPRVASRAVVAWDQLGPNNWRVTLSCGHAVHRSKRLPYQLTATCRECPSQQPSPDPKKEAKT